MAVRALGLLLGYAADRVWGDPRRWHPVAGFARCALAVEQRLYRDSRARGVAQVVLLVAGATGLASARPETRWRVRR